MKRKNAKALRNAEQKRRRKLADERNRQNPYTRSCDRKWYPREIRTRYQALPELTESEERRRKLFETVPFIAPGTGTADRKTRTERKNQARQKGVSKEWRC